MVPGAAAMRVGPILLALVVAVSACNPSVSKINARPEQHYQQKLKVRARIARMQELPGAILLEVVDENGARLLVSATPPVEAEVGDWVKVTGVLVPETKVGDTPLYDVLQAEDIDHTSAPWFQGLF
jgi:hypothetical protein